MLQPDIYVANPFHTQDYNRYSYVLNNPLIYVDPTGLLRDKEEEEYIWELDMPEVVITGKKGGGGGFYIIYITIPYNWGIGNDSNYAPDGGSGNGGGGGGTPQQPDNHWKEGMPKNIEKKGNLYVVPKVTNVYTFVKDKNLREQYNKSLIESGRTPSYSPVGTMLEPRTMGFLDLLFQLAYPIPSLPTWNKDYVSKQERQYQQRLMYWYRREGVIY